MDDPKQAGPFPTGEELMEAVRNIPPGHELIFTADYQLIYAEKPRFPVDLGEPGDGKLFEDM